MVFARLGWTNVLIINPRDMPSLIADLKKYPCNYISGVNTLFNGMMHAPGFKELDFSGAARSPLAVEWPCRRRSPSAGSRLRAAC